MLLFCSDVHCRYELIDQQILHAEGLQGRNVEAAFVVGDLGMFRSELAAYFKKSENGFLRPVYYLEGNHEDFDCFEELVELYRDRMTYLARGLVRKIQGVNLLSFGGTAYMDAATTPRRAVITDEDIDRVLQLSRPEVDVILTHDCPEKVGVPNSPGFEHYGSPGFARSGELAKHLRPRHWIFGHHHKWFETEKDGIQYHGLPTCWQGYGLLIDQEYIAVSHVIQAQKVSWLDRFCRLFGIANRST